MANHPPPTNSRLELACEDTAVRWARAHARDVFKNWAIPDDTADMAVLVISELVTNAVRHTRKPDAPPPWAMTAPPGRCVLTLWYCPDHLLIYVYDDDRTPPVLRPTRPDAIGGRGLHLVDKLSAEWGYLYPTPTSGKTVYAKLKFPGSPAPTDLSTTEQRQIPGQRLGDYPCSMQGVSQGQAHG